MSQREVERQFVEDARATESRPQGWPAALVMFHLSMWRERMRDSLRELAEGKPLTPPPPIERQDELNDAELANGIGTPLADAAARADLLLGEITELYTKIGEQPFQWYRAQNTTEAVLVNSYTHPRLHLFEYLRENGKAGQAYQLWEDAVAEMRPAGAPPLHMGACLYNLACSRTQQGRPEDALKLLEEAVSLRPGYRAPAATDEDLAPLRDDPRFQALIKTP